MTDHEASIGRLADRLLRRIGHARSLDPVAETLRRWLVGASPREVQDALRGTWLGHALHPLLTDFTAGPWMAASFLDLFGPKGSSPAARRLVGFGVVMAVPTLLSGFMDWRDTEAEERRLGLVHAASSSLATLLYVCSLVARRRGNDRVGVVLGVIGGVVAFADGYIGGDLALVRGVGRGRRLPTGQSHALS